MLKSTQNNASATNAIHSHILCIFRTQKFSACVYRYRYSVTVL